MVAGVSSPPKEIDPNFIESTYPKESHFEYTLHFIFVCMSPSRSSPWESLNPFKGRGDAHGNVAVFYSLV